MSQKMKPVYAAGGKFPVQPTTSQSLLRDPAQTEARQKLYDDMVAQEAQTQLLGEEETSDEDEDREDNAGDLSYKNDQSTDVDDDEDDDDSDNPDDI